MKTDMVQSSTKQLLYRRNPQLLVEWWQGHLTLLHTRLGRRFAISPAALLLLDALTEPATIHEIASKANIPPAELETLLDRMSAANVILVEQASSTSAENDWLSLTGYEWATRIQQANLAPGEPVGNGFAPSARLTHSDALAVVSLPADTVRDSMPLADVLRRRRSIRDYSKDPIPIETLGAFLSAACSVRARIGPASKQTTHRASPSAGARHSLEVYLFVRNVLGFESGGYYYDPFAHRLLMLSPWDQALESIQERLVVRPAMLHDAPQVSLYITAVYRRVSWKYGPGSLSLIYRDAGCLLQTMYMVATDLNLAPCAVAAIEPELSPAFLSQWSDQMIHVANFALGSRPGKI